jgi:hypothetical protein
VAFTAAATQRSHREAKELGSESSGEDTSAIVLFQGATARAWRRAYARGVRRGRENASARRAAARLGLWVGLWDAVFAPRELWRRNLSKSKN